MQLHDSVCAREWRSVAKNSDRLGPCAGALNSDMLVNRVRINIFNCCLIKAENVSGSGRKYASLISQVSFTKNEEASF